MVVLVEDLSGMDGDSSEIVPFALVQTSHRFCPGNCDTEQETCHVFKCNSHFYQFIFLIFDNGPSSGLTQRWSKLPAQ